MATLKDVAKLGERRCEYGIQSIEQYVVCSSGYEKENI